jgi:hypothetical protein
MFERMGMPSEIKTQKSSSDVLDIKNFTSRPINEKKV